MNLQSLINGSAALHKTAHIKSYDYFDTRGYVEIAPYYK
jgi:hypothetical protein